MTVEWLAPLFVLASCAALLWHTWKRRQRRLTYSRGRVVSRASGHSRIHRKSLRFGPLEIPESTATGHFLCSGTTGSGKSLVQRLLMYDVVKHLERNPDARILVFDAKNDTMSFLQVAGVSVPVYSLNPFDARLDCPIRVAWDIAADITSCARAQNLAAILIPSEGAGNANQYFTDAARQVVIGMIESFIRHSPGRWTFSDLVQASLSMSHVRAVLERDNAGQAVVELFLGDERMAYQVGTMIASRMAYYRPIAALWANAGRKLSLRKWLDSNSIVLLGSDATAKTALDAINEIVFRIIVEEIDAQSNSSTRRTWVWIDEARLAGPLLRSEMLTHLAVKGRSRGAALVLAFQDIDGFREAAGVRLANELVAQCSHKALLRMESDASAAWASRLIGQQESIEWFRSQPNGLSLKDMRITFSEQRVQRDAVLPSEFFQIPVTSRANGLTGYFLSPHLGAKRGRVGSDILENVFVSDTQETKYGIVRVADHQQWLSPWTEQDYARLALDLSVSDAAELTRNRLRLRRKSTLANSPTLADKA